MSQATDPTAKDDLPHLLDITDVAEALSVNFRHVRRLVYERRIPFIKWGHLIRFDPEEIALWLDSHRHARSGLRADTPLAPQARVRDRG